MDDEYKYDESDLSLDDQREIASVILESEEMIDSDHDNKDLEQDNTISDKECYQHLAEKYKGDYVKTLFEFCFIKNIFFSEKVLKTIVRITNDEDCGKLPEIYVDSILSNDHYKDLTFFDQIHIDNFETIYSEELKILELSEESKKDRQQIMNIIGYDPFEENLPEDRPQLYRDLTGMLTDAMRKDIPKAKAAVEVVTGYNNIRKYQNRVNSLINQPLLDDEGQKQLDKTLEMITKIQNSLNAINDKNGFSNSKSIGTSGRGMLSDVMKTVDDHMYDPGYVNYYDIATSKSIEAIADVSNKSILNQIKLTGQDYTDMLAQQAEIVHKSQKIAREAQEALRLCKAMIKRQELIEQLEKEYKEKGISEEDIKEFIDREYKMWEK